MAKSFVRDPNFGDCPMKIEYEFRIQRASPSVAATLEQRVAVWTVKIDDQIRVRYLELDSKKNAPTDSLGIIAHASDNG
jgi:hypothetical protein